MAEIILTRTHLAETPAGPIGIAPELSKELAKLGHQVRIVDLDSRTKRMVGGIIKRFGRETGNVMAYELEDAFIEGLKRKNPAAKIVDLHNGAYFPRFEKPVKKLRLTSRAPRTARSSTACFYEIRPITATQDAAAEPLRGSILLMELPAIGYFHSKENGLPVRVYSHSLTKLEWRALQKTFWKRPFPGWHYDLPESKKAGCLSGDFVKKVANGIHKLIRKNKF